MMKNYDSVKSFIVFNIYSILSYFAFDTAKDTVNIAKSDVPSVSKECEYSKLVKTAVKKHMAGHH